MSLWPYAVSHVEIVQKMIFVSVHKINRKYGTGAILVLSILDGSGWQRLCPYCLIRSQPSSQQSTD